MALCAYQTSNNYEHVIYVGLDNHVHELIYTGQWRHNDLTTAAKGAPPAAPGSALAGYQTSNNNEHVIFKGANNHVYELVYTGQWACNDLTTAAKGAPPAAPGSALAGYQSPNNNEHVIFEGANNHVYELVYTGQWACNDLTTTAKGAPPAAPGSALAGYQTSNNNEHVIYINTHVYELIYTDHWAYNDVTKAATSATAPPADQGSALAGYQTSNNNEHVIFVGEYHVNELVYTDHWANNDLGGPNAGTGSGLAGYQSSNNNEHVNYIGFDNHVHELVYTGQWRHNDLTTAANGAPPADPESGLAGYQTSNNNLHVNYISVDHHVHELVYTDDQWRHNDLTTAANGAPPAALSSQ